MNLYDQISHNKRLTWALMIGFFIFAVVIAFILGEVWFGDVSVIIPVALFSLIANGAAYFFADKTALAISGAKKVTRNEEPGYYNLVENLTIATGLPLPELYVIETPALNAFATGRDPKHASIAVTRGLMERLEKRELEGVLAHELSHIKNYDIRLMTVVVVLVGLIAMLIEFGWRARMFGGDNRRKEGGNILLIFGLVLIILAPLIANLIKFAVSRQREYLADASGAYMTRYPEALARALEKIASDRQPLPHANAATAHLFISDPLKKVGKKAAGLFSTHPPIEERIRRLRAM